MKITPSHTGTGTLFIENVEEQIWTEPREEEAFTAHKQVSKTVSPN
jgi:hypothetical protein